MTFVHITATRGGGSPPVSARLNETDEVDGLLARAVGSDENGLHVVSIWQSRARQERWATEQLLPTFQSLGMTNVATATEFTANEAGELFIR